MVDPSFWIGLSVLGMVICLAVIQGKDHERLARIESKLNTLLHHFEIEPVSGAALSDRVKELARDPSKKIAAIKAHRDETGAGLAEAKAAIEAFTNSP